MKRHQSSPTTGGCQRQTYLEKNYKTFVIPIFGVMTSGIQMLGVMKFGIQIFGVMTFGIQMFGVMTSEFKCLER